MSERIKGWTKSEKISPMNYCVPVYWNTVVCFVYDSWNRQWLGLVEKVMSGQCPLWHVTTCSLKAKAAQRSLGDHFPEVQPQRPDFTRQKGRVRKATPFLLFWYNGRMHGLVENLTQKLLSSKVNTQGRRWHERGFSSSEMRSGAGAEAHREKSSLDVGP